MSKKRTRRRFITSVGAAGIAGLAGCMGGSGNSGQGTEASNGGGGGDYPSNTVTFVAWASRGGGSDTIVRQGYVRPIRENDLFPVSVRAINRDGGGGESGMRYTLDQSADGHTILNVTTNLIITPLSRDIGITYEDFTPIARMGVEPELLVIRADDDRFSTIKEFKEYASNNRVTVASFDVGTQDHTAAFLLQQRSNMNMEVVPFSGGGEQVSALLGGNVDATLTQPSEVATQRKNDKVEYILQFSGDQLDLYPDLPYVSEVFDFEIVVEQFRGAVVHGDTPSERVSWLRGKFEEISKTDEFKEYAKSNNVDPSMLVGKEFAKYLSNMNKQFTQVFKENNLGIYANK